MALPNLWHVFQPGALTAGPKLGTNVAKGISCDIVVFCFFSGEPPPLSYSVEKRRDPKNARFFGVPPLLNTITQGGVHRKKEKKTHYITTNAFSYIRTEFGALRSRPRAEKHATN